MTSLTEEEKSGYRSAKDNDEREYWARQVIIRQLREYRDRNQDLLRVEHRRVAKWILVAFVISGFAMIGVAKQWL